MNAKKNYLNAADVSAYMGISIPMAYKIIRKLNDELRAQGFITGSGRINRRYFEHNGHAVYACRSFVPGDLQIRCIEIVPAQYLLHETTCVHALFPFCPFRLCRL